MADVALDSLIDRVRAARADKTPLAITGGGTKAFYGGPVRGTPLDVRPLAGISSYEPSELVVTVRAGTPLATLEAALAEQGQCLPFEPPRFGAASTVGGMVAAGLAGPARAAVGGVRDYVLGATLLNGKAEILSFGGQVMKNVAGYDVSRLLAGSLGVLGVLCEVSLKVLPVPVASATLRFELDQAAALKQLNTWGGQPLPVNASAWWDGMLVLRLSGAAAAVQSARRRLGGEPVDDALAAGFWQGLRDQTDEFFIGAHKAVEAGDTVAGARALIGLNLTTLPKLGVRAPDPMLWQTGSPDTPALHEDSGNPHPGQSDRCLAGRMQLKHTRRARGRCGRATRRFQLSARTP